MQQHSLLHILSPRAKIAYLLSLSLVRGKKDFIFIFILRYQIIVYCDVYTLLIYMHQNNETEFLFPTQMDDNDSILLCLNQGMKIKRHRNNIRVSFDTTFYSSCLFFRWGYPSGKRFRICLWNRVSSETSSRLLM